MGRVTSRGERVRVDTRNIWPTLGPCVAVSNNRTRRYRRRIQALTVSHKKSPELALRALSAFCRCLGLVVRHWRRGGRLILLRKIGDRGLGRQQHGGD